MYKKVIFSMFLIFISFLLLYMLPPAFTTNVYANESERWYEKLPRPYKGMLSFIDTDKDVYSIGEPIKIRVVIINVDNESKYREASVRPQFVIVSLSQNYQFERVKNLPPWFVTGVPPLFPMMPKGMVPCSYYPHEYKIFEEIWRQKDVDWNQVLPGDYLIVMVGGGMSSYQLFKRIKIEVSASKNKSYDAEYFSNLSNSSIPEPVDGLITYVIADKDKNEVNSGNKVNFQAIAANVGGKDLIFDSGIYPVYELECSTCIERDERLYLDKKEPGKMVLKRGEVKIYSYTTSQCRRSIAWYFFDKGAVLY